MTASPVAAQPPAAPTAAGQLDHDSSGPAAVCGSSTQGSPYIPVDSWVYPAVLRLYSMGYADHVYLGMRPWTRSSLSHMLENVEAQIEDANKNDDPTAGEAQDIYAALARFLHYDAGMQCLTDQSNLHIEAAYSVARGISGTPLRDSFHLGSTIINDYGRPYENGSNNYTGASGYATAGRFTLYVRGEFQGAPSAAGYSQALAQALSTIDGTAFLNAATGLPYNQATIPMGPIATVTQGRFLEAYLSALVLNHEISFGKQDEWLGPGLGGGMAYSNNAENIYSFRINRIEPLYIPLLSRITGSFRYDFLVGSLRGHTYMPNPANPGGANPNLPNVINPGDPWVHLEKISFRPTDNLEFGFERTVIWGGQGHEPITLHTFLKSFFSVQNVSATEKDGRNDPGARFGAFDFSYRLPFVRKWLTLYTDSEVHDDVSPADAPRRAAYRPGIYLSHLPGVPKLDLRVEAASTDPSSSGVASQYGHFMYWETIQRQGYTNQGQLFGDWIGREDKGGQAWLTYHLSGDEQLQMGWRNQKAATYFIPGGTTLNDANFQAMKRIGKNFEINGNFSLEHWKAPIYPTGTPTYPAGGHTVTITEIQLTWFPSKKVHF
ncbi:MAG: capsule assembly Wzi family protein [Terracidiphilus sp.]